MTIGIVHDKPLGRGAVFDPERNVVWPEGGLKAAGLRVVELFIGRFRVMDDPLQVLLQDTPLFQEDLHLRPDVQLDLLMFFLFHGFFGPKFLK